TPAQELVVAYIQERKPKLRQSRKIQSLFAVKMSFVILAHTKEGLMGIDEEHRMAASGLRGRDRPRIRTCTLPLIRRSILAELHRPLSLRLRRPPCGKALPYRRRIPGPFLRGYAAAA